MAGVGLTDGKDFLGEGYVRVNFACPRATLMEGLRRMEMAIISGYREKEEHPIIEPRYSISIEGTQGEG